jgi:predicted dehydrogenase
MQRRTFLKVAGTSLITLGLPRFGRAALSANDDVRLALIGIGSAEAKGGVGGRGRQLMSALQKVRGARLVALCDVDQRILARQAGELKDRGQAVVAYGDLRRVLDSKEVDAVIVATPNHWHALATTWACQAGKDVYVEKPISHNIWEGRQMVAAARKYGRLVQAGTQARTSSAMREAVEWVQRGELGRIRFGRVILYRERAGIGKVTQPTPIPAEVDYDLWCGPTDKLPLRHQQLHYDWHWIWPTGSGEMGNNGVHHIDLCRWAMKLETTPPRVISLGGRFGFDDDGETPNTHVALLGYEQTPIYCEVRGLPEKKGSKAMDSFLNTRVGTVIQCEGGYLAGAHLAGAAYDLQGKKIRDFGPTTWEAMDSGHLANFVAATRSRKVAELRADVLEGHLSAACCHLINISHRLGRTTSPEDAVERVKADSVLLDAVARCQEHLRANEVDLAQKEILGPALTFDVQQERFTGEYAESANAFLRRPDRAPFIVPGITG